LTPSFAQRLQKHGQREQFLDSEEAPAGSQDSEDVRPLDVRPTSRQTHARFTGGAEEHSLFAPGVGVAQQLENLAGPGVERMDDAKQLRIAAIAYS